MNCSKVIHPKRQLFQPVKPFFTGGHNYAEVEEFRSASKNFKLISNTSIGSPVPSQKRESTASGAKR